MSSAKDAPAAHVADNELKCPYCTAAIRTDVFVTWPGQPRLTTGICGGCGRSVTVPSLWLTRPRVASEP